MLSVNLKPTNQYVQFIVTSWPVGLFGSLIGSGSAYCLVLVQHKIFLSASDNIF